MVKLGSALCTSAKKMLLLGSGELGKEVAIEAQRLGIEVIACDRYQNAPAMQVAHRSYVFDMLDDTQLETIIKQEQPDFIVPEIEAIATSKLVQLEQEGFNVVPSAKAVHLTMNREGIRRLVSETLNIQTSNYQFCETVEQFQFAVNEIGIPCVVKPIMSSSGKGQSVIKSVDDIQQSWDYAQEGGRAGKGRVIVEGFVDFDYEITLLTINAIDGIHFCAPIGHRQENGDYQESWQPAEMSEQALLAAKQMAEKVVLELGGFGLFGVEFFVKGTEVIFSELSPRPHDTGLVTLISQNQSEFALHVRAILNLPITYIEQLGNCASAVVLAKGISKDIEFEGVQNVLSEPNTQVRLFAKPEINGPRRLAVVLHKNETIESAVKKAIELSNNIKVILN
ncbi:formate-dependent phosphoribosylglycinamide formyltransferase [Marinicellulosiphila megalodicopiae]|uniref:formate-dependent phosphoribosylglycinamide formyltransferase n=1 Tax=Marinicellulosiphila megalodicopiae TaxID=2724896 RepID=UPI003BB04938